MALVLRIAVKSPAYVLSKMSKTPGVFVARTSDVTHRDGLLRWMTQAWANAGTADKQADFESRLASMLVGETKYKPGDGSGGVPIPVYAEVDIGTLRAVRNWPGRLKQFHLDPSELHASFSNGDTLIGLQSSPGSSPFLKHSAGAWVFDDMDFAWRQTQGGHPPPANAPFRLSPDDFTSDLRAFGIAPAAPAAAWGVAPNAKSVVAQAARELQIAAADAHVFVGGVLKQNPHPHQLRVHGLHRQRWVRLQWHDFQQGKQSSALLCGASKDAPPKPAEALWALDAVPGATVYAFDGRRGKLVQSPLGQFDQGAQTAARSKADALDGSAMTTFGLPATPLAEATFALFKNAVSDPEGSGVAAPDSFAVKLDNGAIKIRFGWLRHTLAIGGKADQTGELGFYMELLNWRARAELPDSEAQQYLRSTGFEFLPRKNVDLLFDFTSPQHLTSSSLQLPLKLWQPQKSATAASFDCALAMLTWPALHRWRETLRASPLARRAMWDCWRLSLREMLLLPALPGKLGREARLFRLFQSPECLAVLAYWIYRDAGSLEKHLASKKFAGKVSDWLKGHDADYTKWTDADEADMWGNLVGTLDDGDLKAALIARTPAAHARPAYRAELEQLIYLAELDGTGRQATSAARAGFVVLPAPKAHFGIALLTEASTAPALFQAKSATASYRVVGIAPYIGDDPAGARGAAIPLSASVDVMIQAGSGAETLNLVAPGAASSEQLTLSHGDILSDFSLEADVGAWLGPLGEGVSVTLLAAASNENNSWTLKCGFRVGAAWLRAPIEYPLTPVLSITDIVVDLGQRKIQWAKDLALASDALHASLPFRGRGRCALTLGLDGNLDPALRFEASLSTIEMQLGSPIASLGLVPEPADQLFSIAADLTTDSASIDIQLPDRISATLRLELAATSTARDATRVVPLINAGQVSDLLAPIVISLGTMDVPKAKAAAGLRLRAGLPELPGWLFADGPLWHPQSPGEFSMPDIADNWFAGGSASLFAKLADRVAHVLGSDRLTLTLPMSFTFRLPGQDELMSATASLTAACPVVNGYLQLAPNAFSCDISKVALEFNVAKQEFPMGDAAKLVLPKRLKAELDLSGQASNALAFTSLHDDPVRLQFPAEGGFSFDISRLELGAGGVSLEASVRKGAAAIGDLPTLEGSLNVRPSDGTVGKLVIERGRLVSASLAADARLRFFDDADGVLTLTLFQDEDGRFGAMTKFNIAVGRSFNVRALYLRVDVQSVQLSLSYVDKKWSATGGMSGSCAFVANGPLAGRLAEYQSLFDGTSVHFENLNLADLGQASLTVLVTPRTFDVAGIFRVTWRGFTIPKLGQVSLKSIKLLGDISLAVPLKDLRAELTLGDIVISQPDAQSLVPKIRISTIGVAIAMPSSFRFKGRLTEFDDEQEYGFGGAVYMESDAFPGATALLKLTRLRIKDRDPVPSFVVYVGVDRTDHLAYGFFLRKLGLGVAANQGLRNFTDAAARDKPLPQRIQGALVSGIPNPGELSSWVAVPPKNPGDTAYSVVADAQVTLGCLDRQTQHPFVTQMLVSIDDDFTLQAGASGWLAVSPDEAQQPDFIDHPAVRGALGFSPRKQEIYGSFITLQHTKYGASVDLNVTTALMRRALDACRLSVTFLCTRDGALLEIGYPRQARFALQLGPVNGAAEAGFRIGYYRGTLVVGVNLAVMASVSTGFSAGLGFADVEVAAVATFALQGAFAGAVTNAGQLYLLADLSVSAAFSLSVRLHKEIRVSGFWGSFTVPIFNLRTSLNITATAALRAALVPSGLGFSGYAEVALGVFGFSFHIGLSVSFDGGRVDEARRQIDALVPPIDEIIKPAPAALPAPVTALAARVLAYRQPQLLEAIGLKAEEAPRKVPQAWCYHVRRVGGVTRVVLYPNPMGDGYPRQTATRASHRINFNSAGSKAFVGLVGRKVVFEAGKTYVISEPVDEVLIPENLIQPAPGTSAQPLLARHLLENIALPAEKPLCREIVDPRTQAPVAGDFDDPAVLADPRRRSTRFRKRYGEKRLDGEGPLQTYDDYVLAAQLTTAELIAPTGALTDAELLTGLLHLAESDLAQANVEQPLSIGTGQAEQPNPLRLPALMGLVLEFSGTDMAEQIGQHGIAAFAQDISMLDTPVAASDWDGPSTREESHLFESNLSYWFQGQGEIGLSWQFSRVAPGGVLVGAGPCSHRAVRHFEIRREDLDERLPPTTSIIRPSWVVYREPPREGEAPVHYYIRPQFQFVDSGLPTDVALNLRYTVRAVGCDHSYIDQPDSTLCSEVYDLVRYQPVQEQAEITQSQALLRIPGLAAGNSTVPAPAARLELLVAVSIPDTKEDGGVLCKRLAPRLSVMARPVERGTLGIYGSGTETDVSLLWRKELSGSDLRLPQPAQLRRMNVAQLADATEVSIAAADWTVFADGDFDRGDGALSGKRMLVLGTTILFTPGKEAETWKRLGIAAGGAAEFHLCLKASTTADGKIGTATAYQRARMALTSTVTPPAGSKAKLDGGLAPESLFAQGSEVAALERYALNAPARPREWAKLDKFSVVPQIGPLADGGDRLQIRLAGTLQHHAAGRDSLAENAGAPVAYRVWLRDAIDDLDLPADAPRPMQVVRDFAVLPEKIYRSLPERVVVQKLAADNKNQTQLDWTFEDGRRLQMPASEPPSDYPPLSSMFAKVACNGGADAIVHHAIGAFGTVVPGDGQICYSMDEPLSPPMRDALVLDRAAELLKRCADDNDHFGWRLLEGLGAAATVWLELDDDRATPVLPSEHTQLAAITFEMLAPADRPGPGGLPLYGIRLFAQEVLNLVFHLTPKTPQERRDWLAGEDAGKRWSPLHHALNWLTPRAANSAAVPDSWIALVDALCVRCARFVDVGAPRNSVRMRHVATLPAAGPDDAPAAAAPANAQIILPAVLGMVEFSHLREEGYASELQIAVEVVRRYDFHPLADGVDLGAPGVPPPTLVVSVPRTLALATDRAAMSIDVRDGSIQALVQVHPAQRAHLAAAPLSRRVQFLRQRITLQRSVSKRAADAPGFVSAMLADQRVDWDAYAASWPVSPRAEADWHAAADLPLPPADVVTRGVHVLRYPLLPSAYAWRVAVQTRAGARSSDDQTPGPDDSAVAAMEPLFVLRDGLGYRDLQWTWSVEGGDLQFAWPLARAIDALPERWRAYWGNGDQHADVDSTAGRSAPVLQLPDLRASYMLTAIRKEGNVSVDLLQLVYDQSRNRFNSCVLVSPYAGSTVTFAPLQFDAGAVDESWRGRLGMAGTLSLDAPELDWLATSLRNADGVWTLACTTLRDGLRFNLTEVA
ncbi:hypothetical protein D0T25_12185 [Duganella sp. BJB488]|nr:hypothetical protein D0T25_12185 [Duganella sp. BJB488]RFP37363.1 hypothetical protein D0T24_05030 [Duganella sp. BJB480]